MKPPESSARAAGTAAVMKEHRRPSTTNHTSPGRLDAVADVRAVVLAAIRPSDLLLYPASPFTLVAAHTTADAMELLARVHPRVVAIDWDARELDAPAICHAARRLASVLVTTTPECVPAALKAGCHAVLLKPFAPNLVAARVGRLLRQNPPLTGGRGSPTLQPRGTNHVWPDMTCPRCGARGVTSFEFSSHRRMWYACLACERVWVGVRREI